MNLPASTGRAVGALSLTALLALPAQAHHAMEGRMPQSWGEGLLSGLAHPVIEIDHALFLLGAALWLGRMASPGTTWRLSLVFAGAGLAGTAVHAAAWSWPGAEAAVALSLCVLAVVLWLPQRLASQRLVPALAALAVLGGFVHGYAYGESIVGAERAPLAAYLIGLALVQAALLTGAAWAWRRVAAGWVRLSHVAPRLLGAGLAVLGTAALLG